MNQFIPRRKRNKFSYGSGDKFGRLTLTGLTYTKTIYGHWVRFVEAICDCGVVKEYAFTCIASGDTQSCGCLRKEVTRKRATTHNLSNHKLYDIWQQMIARCYNTNNSQYKDYGGRGIEVWKNWKDEFIDFYEWCIKNGYQEDLSLDRTDNDGNYGPYNCRFATRAEQSRNKRKNIFITAFGETKCLFDWGRDKRCKVSVWGLVGRYKRGRYTDMEKMISDSVADRKTVQRNNKSARMFTAFGETKCMSAWLEDSRCLVKIDSFRDRLAKGWDAEKTMTMPPTRSGKNGYQSK